MNRSRAPGTFYARYGKRVLDVIVSGAGLGLGWPVLAGVAAAVRWRLGTPVLFKQRRPGLDGRIFTIFKFRTMTEAMDPSGRPLSDADRLTPFGRFLRSTSLDELPELWNVLRGDMSLVGPRPLLPEYLDRYTERQARRHQVRPGITGWAQIGGRNALPWKERFERDVWYVDNLSLVLDLRIVLLTVVKVLVPEGVSQPGRATVDYFMGEEEDAA